MKKLLLAMLVITFAIGIVISMAVVIYPHLYYFNIVKKGIDSEYINLNACSGSPICNGGEYNEEKTSGMYKDNDSLWREFHFGNYLISLPIHHQLTFVPLIKDIPGKLQLGAKFLDFNKEELISFHIGEIHKFSLPINEQKLFKLPLFKNYILKMNIRKLWRDLFYMNLVFSIKMDMKNVIKLYKAVYSDIKNYKQEVYQDLVYNLFIIYFRNKLLKEKDTISISFKSDQGLGIQEIKDPDEKFRLEKIYIFQNGVLYTLMIRSRKRSTHARAFRRKIISGLGYKASNEDARDIIYNEYKTLDYSKRTGQQGLIYLFSVWAHEPGNKNVLRVIIQFLERGKTNFTYLKPLYEYSLKHFGTTFLMRDKHHQEGSGLNLKEKTKEEKSQGRIKEEEGLKKANTNEDFESDEAKIEYYLKKAKGKGSLEENDEVEESEMLNSE